MTPDLSDRTRGRAITSRAVLRVVPAAGFDMDVALEMQTIICYLQRAAKCMDRLERASKRAGIPYLAVIPPDQKAALRALAPALRVFLEAIDEVTAHVAPHANEEA